MIGRLRGALVHKQAPYLLLDVNGVGYEIEATMSTFYGLPEPGGVTTLYTHLIVRDDAQLLYGFASAAERALFRELIKVNGVGAKLALTILSGMSVDAFSQCVLDNDGATLTRLPGVGKKTAARLIVEMRDRCGVPGGVAESAMTGVAAEGAREAPVTAVNDAIGALVTLGYKPQEARRMIQGIDTADMSSDQIIRQALQQAVNVK